MGDKRKESLVKDMKPKELMAHCSNMPPEQIVSLLRTIEPASPMIHALVRGLKERAQLEAVGKVISSHQLLDLMDECLRSSSHEHWKLSPILVGMAHETFVGALLLASDLQLDTFVHDCSSESLQHHLTVLAHDLRNRIEGITRRLNHLESHLIVVDVELLTRSEIADLSQSVDDLSMHYQQVVELINRALSIAWNTDRLDLIELFTIEKESCQRILVIGVGHPKRGNRQPTGLYALLDEKLTSIYGNPLDEEDIEALQDDEPAKEALVKLSIWYLRDYWDLGLIPHIKRIEDLNLDMRKHNEVERKKFRDQLFEIAQKNLELVGLVKVKDLKDNLIYSKKSLQKYLKDRGNR